MIKPLNGNLLIEPLKVEQTDSGIYIASKDVEKTNQAKVIECDSELVKPGDKIIYSQENQIKVKSGDDELVFISESDIIAVYVD